MTVSTVDACPTTWTEAALDKLGGIGSTNRIWGALKDREMTGNSKRTADHLQDFSPKKKFKLDENHPCPEPATPALHAPSPVACTKGTTCIDMSNLCLPKNTTTDERKPVAGQSTSRDQPLLQSTPAAPENKPAGSQARKKAKARRKSIVSTPKITTWLQIPSPIPSTTPNPNHANSTFPDAVQLSTHSQAKKRRTKRKKVTSSTKQQLFKEENQEKELDVASQDLKKNPTSPPYPNLVPDGSLSVEAKTMQDEVKPLVAVVKDCQTKEAKNRKWISLKKMNLD